MNVGWLFCAGVFQMYSILLLCQQFEQLLIVVTDAIDLVPQQRVLMQIIFGSGIGLALPHHLYYLLLVFHSVPQLIDVRHLARRLSGIQIDEISVDRYRPFHQLNGAA